MQDVIDKLLETEQFEKAEICLRIAVEVYPDSGCYNNSLGCCLSAQGRCVEAEPYLRKAVEVDPDDGCYNNNLGYCLNEQGRGVEAEPYLRKAVDIEPENAFRNTNLALCLARHFVTNGGAEGLLVQIRNHFSIAAKNDTNEIYKGFNLCMAGNLVEGNSLLSEAFSNSNANDFYGKCMKVFSSPETVAVAHDYPAFLRHVVPQL